MSKFILYILLTGLIAAFSSCNNTTVYENTASLGNKAWYYNDSISFDVRIESENMPYNVFIDIENTDYYKYSNLFLFISIKSPDSTVITDTVDVFMSNYQGKWVGEPNGDNFYGSYSYKHAVAFPKPGIYKTTIVHGMREDSLKGITRIGVSVKEIK